ncbi:MAG: twin-arginine translocase subunit TatC [Flavobacteriales bacterium]
MENNEQANGDDVQMSFLQHLEELRWHLVRSAIAIMAVAIVAFLSKEFVFDSVIFAPKKEEFITFRALCWLSHKLHSILPAIVSNDAICIGKGIPELQNISMAGQFATHIIVSIIVGLIVAFPYVFWELWRFVRPALKNNEQKRTRGVVFSSSLLFMTGAVFGYFVIVPLSVNFLSTYSISESVKTIPTLSSYITTVTMIVLACGIIFELPLLVVFLTRGGLISPAFLKKFRRHAVVVSLIVSAIITPPDVFSQLLVSIPLLMLYEVSIWLSAVITKRAEKAA